MPGTQPKEAMNPKLIADAYIDTWNEGDARKRGLLFDEHWTNDARYEDPLMQGEGVGAIGALADAVRERFPDFRFQLRGDANGHGRYVRLAWSLGPAGQVAPIEGSDVIELHNGRISRVIGFIDRAPTA